VYFIPSDLAAGTTTCRYRNGSTFTVTAAVAPTVSSSAATSVGSTAATLNGSVDSDGGSPITERGFVYRVGTGVTIADNKTTVSGATGAYTLHLTTLSPGTLYSFKAYAINVAGTTLSSPELTFTTSASATAPAVDSPTSSAIGVTTATLGATVQSDDDVSIDDYGVVWGLSANPTTADNKIQKGTSSTPPETFTVSASGLNAGTLIHYRGYAHNSVGTGYSTDASFSTLSTEPTLQASGVTFTGVGGTNMTINFASGDGSSRIVLVKSGSAVNSDPVDGTTYTASTTFGSGSQIGTGNFVVFAGSGNSVTISGLSPSTFYHVAVYEFNGSSGTENYLTTSPAINNQQTTAQVATTYTWNQTGSADWTTAANWTPARNTPATDDVLIFNNGANSTVLSVPAQTIGKLQVSGNTTVNLQAGAANTLTVGAAASDALTVASGSQLNVNGTNALTINQATGAKGSISGSMTFSTATNRLTAANAIGITFNSGSTFTQGAGNTGNIFGSTGTANAIVFASGATFISQAGASPFGLSEPNSKVIFQTGSLYSHQQALSPSFSGRTYANFEQNVNATITVTGSNAVSIDDLTVTQGTLNFNMTGTPDHSIQGNITVASGATLNFTPATAGTVNLNGSSLQTISGSGNVSVSPLSTIVIDNAAGISLQKSITIDGTITLTDGIVTSTGANLLTVSSTGAVSGGSATSYFDPRVAQVYSGTGPKTFPIGKGGNFRPLTLNSTQAGTSTITAEQFESALTGSLPTNTCLLESRFWTVTRAEGGSFTYDITLNAPGFTPAGPLIVKKDGSIVAFTATQAGNSFTTTGLSGLSDFAVGQTCAPPTATVSGDQTICTGGSATIQALMTGTGPWSITWSDGVTDTNFSDNPHTRNVSPTSLMTYTITAVSDSTGIPGGTSSGSATVTVNAQPSGPTLASKSPNLSAVCDGQSVSATFTAGSGGVGCSDSYQFSTDNGATYSPYTPGNPINTSGSTGVIIRGKRDGCTSGAGCTGTAFTTLASWTVNPPPTCSITPPSATVCSPQTQQFCAPAAMSSYAWTGPGGFAANSQCITVSTGGTYTVTIVDSGCTNSCQATLTVDTVPTITCPSNITTTNDAGLCSALLTFSPTSTGSLECKIGATVITSPHAFDVGTNTVSCTASNGCGTTNCAFTVIVNDTEPPAITCPANVLTNTDAGLCVVSNVVLGVPVSTNDNCGVASVTNDAPGDLTFGAGTNDVIWIVTDIHGNQSSCTQQVIVVDNQAPTISCPADVTVNTDSGLCTANGVNLGVPSATNDNCGVSTVVNNAAASYPVGTNAVVWTVTDIHGNQSACTQQVIVVDNQKPTISCPADITVTNITTVTWSLGVSDNCPGVTNSCSPTNGSTFAAGTTGVNCTATDTSGNTANCSFNVTVVATATPTIACPADVTVPSAPGQCSSNFPFVVAAIGVPTPSVECKIGSLVITSPYLFPVGINTVDCTASNDYGTATCSFTVAIQDTEAPTISCPATVTVNTDSGLCTASDVDLGVPSATSDNCGVNTLVNNAAASYPVGTNAVVWTVTDIHGNTATCTQQVIVVDNQAPTINCPANIVTSADPGQCGKSNVTYTATAADNCTNVTVSCTPASGSTFVIGTNSVTCTATDSSGNTNSCTFTVTVVVDEPPVVSCPTNIVTSVDPGQCTKSNVTYSATASDNCTNVTLSYNPPSGSTLPSGTTTVYVNATDASGNSAAIKVFGDINTAAGNGISGYGGDGGAATTARLNSPYRVAVDRSGNLFIADLDNQRIRRVDAATGIITTVAGNGISGYSGDGGAATNASLNSPTDMALDRAGNLFIADFYNARIRRVDAATGIITTVAGNGISDYSGDGGAATNAMLNFTYGVAVDSSGNLFIADTGNSCVRRVDTGTGIITTVAGNGGIGYSGDGGAATNARLNGPFDVALDGAGNLFIADFYNARIRRVDAATGMITTVAGNGHSGYNGDGGAATSAKLYGPFGVALDMAGNLFIADWFNYRVRRVDSGSGIITTVAGSGSSGYNGDGRPATSARLTDPTGVAVDRAGNLFITELNGQRVRRVDAVAACTFAVTVKDTEPPSITCPPNIVTSTTPGTCVASNVTWTVTAADNCTNATVSCTPASGSTFAVGTNNVTCTATDSSGNTNSCSFTVTVNGAQPPVISTCASNQTLSANGSCQALLPDLTGQVVATDNCGGTPTVTQSPAAGTLLGLGTNSVTFTVDDGRGNSNSCTAMVIVRDVTPPVIHCPSDITVNANPGVCFATGVSLGTVTASDNCGVAAVSSNAPASFPVGTNAVVWTATDPSGNSATCTQRVVVVDNQAPVITCPADVIVRIPVEATHARDVVLASPVVTDNCGVNSLINDASSCYAVGTNLVVWTGTDPSGNSATCTQRVIVVPVTVTSANFRIVGIRVIGQNVLLTWETFGSSTNIIQTVSPVFRGNYSNNYINVGSVWVPGAGSTITNWIDSGGATNVPSRYYRIGFQLVDPSCAP
jgi:hypothetical protein